MRPEQLFSLLGDATRLSILEALTARRGGLAVGEIAEVVGAKEPSVSQHLKVLRDAGLVAGRRRGRRVVYRIEPASRRKIADTIARLPGAGARPRIRLSARNRLLGTVTGIQRDGVTSGVTLDVGGQTVHAVITTDALDDLALRVGDAAYAVVKATEVMLMR